jgi:hypothetical protein
MRSISSGKISIARVASLSTLPMLRSVQAGKFAHRFGSPWLLMFGAVRATLGMPAPYIVPELSTVFVVWSTIGMSAANYYESLQNLTGLLSDSHNRAQNVINYSSIQSACNIVGPVIAGLSVKRSGHAINSPCLHYCQSRCSRSDAVRFEEARRALSPSMSSINNRSNRDQAVVLWGLYWGLPVWRSKRTMSRVFQHETRWVDGIDKIIL